MAYAKPAHPLNAMTVFVQEPQRIWHRDTIIAIEPPEGTIEFWGEPLKFRTIWPKDKFVQYERSDEWWAIPLGFAKRVTEPIRCGDVVELEHYYDGCESSIVITNMRRDQNEPYKLIGDFRCLTMPTTI